MKVCRGAEKVHVGESVNEKGFLKDSFSNMVDTRNLNHQTFP